MTLDKTTAGAFEGIYTPLTTPAILESEVGDQFHQRCEELPATDSILPSLEQLNPTSQRASNQ
jgi:hypothetical protein